MRLRIDLAYDGTDFHGWAAQDELRTVQGELELWLGRILRIDAPSLVVAGRTDAGVHASAQVAHLDVAGDVSPEELQARLERVLPEDIAIRRVSEASKDFDARFAATQRHYRYLIWDADSRPDPILRTNVTRLPRRLDLEAMNTAGQSLLGLHDFAPFCKRRDGATTIRELQRLETHRLDDEARTIAVEVSADAFCHSMVRSLVGALVAVGGQERDLTWLAETAKGSVRANDVYVMPAKGLTLIGVDYPPDDQLAARAEQARSTRTLIEET